MTLNWGRTMGLIRCRTMINNPPITSRSGTNKDGKDCLKMLEVALGFHHGMKVVQGIIGVHGESDQEVEKRCQEYGKRLVKEIEK